MIKILRASKNRTAVPENSGIPTEVSLVFDDRLRFVSADGDPSRLLFGYTVERLSGMDAGRIESKTGSADRKAAAKLTGALRKAQSERRNVHFEYDVVSPDGAVWPVVGYVRCGDDGRVVLRLTPVSPDDREPDLQPADRSGSGYKELFQALDAGVEYYGADGTLLEMNAYMADLFGVEEDFLHLLGSNLYTKPDFPDSAKEAVRRGEKSRFSVEYDFDSVTREGRYRTRKQGKMHLEVRTSPVFKQPGVWVGTIVVLVDTTEPVQLRKEYERLYRQNQAILEALPVGVELYASGGTLNYLNDRICEIFGVTRREALSGKVSIDDNPNYPDEVKAAVRSGKKIHRNFSYDFERVRESAYYDTVQESRTKQIDYRGTPVFGPDGEVENYVFIVDDITEFYHQTRLLEETRQDLLLALKSSELSVWILDVKTLTFSSMYGDMLTHPGGSLRQVLDGVHPDDREICRSLIESIAAGRKEQGETVFRFFDRETGRYRYYESKMGARRDENGRITHVTGTRQDITQQTLRMMEIENARRSLGMAMEAADIVAWDYDPQAGESRILFGENEDESPEDFPSRVHPADRDAFRQHYGLVAAGLKGKDRFLARIRRRGADYRYFESTISSVRDDGGNVVHLIGTLKDVTETRSVEHELKKQKEFVTLALEAGDMAVWIYDIAAEIFSSLEGNALAGSGLTLEQNLALLHPEDAAVFEQNIAPVIDGAVSRKKLRLRYEASDVEGGYRYIESSLIPIREEGNRITHLVGTQKDVTHDYQQQVELSRSKRKADLAIRTADIVLWEYDGKTGQFTCYNEPLNDYDESRKVTELDYFECMHPDDLEPAREAIAYMKRGEDRSVLYDVRMRTRYDSEWQYCTISGTPFERDETGSVVKYVGFRRNNTDLQKKRALLSTILNDLPVPIHIKDIEHEHRYVFWNEESKKIFGGDRFRSAVDVVGEGRAAEIHCIEKEVFETGVPYFGSERLKTLDGREYEMIVRKSVIYDGDQKRLLVVRWDESLQNELRRKSKVLSLSVDALQAYTWYLDSRDGALVFGDGFEKTGGDRTALGTIEKYAARIHLEDREQFLRFMADFMEQEKGDFSVEYRIDLADTGRYEWWECRGVMETIRKNGETYQYVYGMDVNIDSHKKTELALLRSQEELAHLIRQNELVLNNTNSGLAFISADYVVQWENVSVCSASVTFEAYKRGELCYKSAHNRTSPCANCVMQRAMRSKQTERIAFDFKNGKTVEVFATPVLNAEGAVEGVVIRLDDITERKQMIRALQEAKRQAEQSDHLKSAFLANMSHEIRTPLNAIVGFSELLMQAEELAEKEAYWKIISANNELLLKLIGDILDLSKIEAGFVELKRQPFDLSECFEEVAVAMAQRVVNPNVRFRYCNPYGSCRIELDKNRLIQILTNYATNAIKYTAEGYIEMGYEYVREGIRLYVKDSGIGISEEKKNKVFCRFEKLDEFAQGTGLGLSICKAIVDAFDGEVGFESRFGEGSEFWAWIPCKADVSDEAGGAEPVPEKQSEAFPAPQEPAVAGSGRKKILVAEDISSNYLLVQRLLRKEYDLEQALNGAEAVERARGGGFDLILMDMKMPVMSGLEATARIRTFDPEIPIVALTAHAFESDKEAALAAGCNDYLVKPVSRDALLTLLHAILPE